MMRFLRCVAVISLMISMASPAAVYASEVATEDVPSEEITVLEAALADDSKAEAALPAPEPQQLATPAAESSPTSEQAPAASPEKILISKFKTGPGAEEFVEIFNPNDYPVSLSGWQLEYLSATHDGLAAPTRILASMNVTLEAQGYHVLKHSAYALESASADFTSSASGGSLAKTGGSIRLVRTDKSIADLAGWGSAKQKETKAVAEDDINTWQRCTSILEPMVDTDNNAADFAVYDSMKLRLTPACSLPEPPVPVSYCSGVVISEIGANLEQQFVELYNTAAEPVDLSGCLLATNRSSANFALEGSLAAGGYTAILVADTPLTLTKTTTGTVYLLSSDGGSETDTQAYGNLRAGTSWARFGDGDLRQTFAPTPGAANEWQEFLPCQAGYERNLETGMCRKIPAEPVLADCGPGRYRSEETGRCRQFETIKTPVPCRDNQYRSEETGRCRNIAGSASALKPCRDDQYRSEETNRCRNLASVVRDLVPCSEGQERNPETNRCRNIQVSDIPEAAFAVEPIAEAGTALAGWWALGGAGSLALGYAAFEWRREAMTAIRKVSSFFTSGR